MMMSEIVLSNVRVEYPIFGASGRSMKNTLLSAAAGGFISGVNKSPVVRALHDVSFEFKNGDRVGLVGHNGAGKSTLLKVLAGIYTPTSGRLSVTGRVVSTLNLSLGMEMEATGIENIFIRGLLLGMKMSEIEEKIEEISDFTQLGPYLDMPVRIYSTGMLTRLAFATVTAIDADILLMDEVIGTGDAAFVNKAEERLRQFVDRSKIMVLASHSNHMIREFCNKAILLQKGEVKCIGTVDEIFEKYADTAAQ